MNLAGLTFALLRPLLRAADAETAHRATITLLKSGLAGDPRRSSRLSTRAFGLTFANPLGLAAGFDKNAEVPVPMLRLGFGFVEVGTVTPLPQAGNPRPRLLRLAEDEAVINRMGFNNEGHAATHRRLAKLGQRDGIVGVNIGANKDSPDRIADYVAGYRRFADVADYIALNVSSPNTPGLRSLQSGSELRNLLAALAGVKHEIKSRPPLLLKIAPDLSVDELAEIAEACMDAPVDGIIVSNTTISRPSLRSRYQSETGGLSGRPLFCLSTRQLARLYLLTKGQIPLIGVGGISGAESAWMKIRAGASLIQLYTALIYRGPALVDEIINGLESRLARSGYGFLVEAVGGEAAALADHGSSGT